MSRVSLAVGVGTILLAAGEGFCPGGISVPRPTGSLNMAHGPAGSFFHQVPDEKDNNDDAFAKSVDINDQFAEILRRRGQPPRASKPSTISGIPTSQVTGEYLHCHTGHSRYSTQFQISNQRLSTRIREAFEKEIHETICSCRSSGPIGQQSDQTRN